MTLFEILQGQLDDNVLGQLSDQIGASKEQTASAASNVFATLLGGLANNATDENSLQSLGNALDNDHDGSILDNVGNMLGMVNQGSSTMLNGAGILKHVFGGQQETVAEQVGQSSGLNTGQILKLMMALAPIVMGVLGKVRREGNIGLGDLASILMGSAQNAQGQSGMGDLLGGLLGNVLGGQLGGLLGGNQPQQQQQQPTDMGDMIGSVLGGLFGKR